ncbi:unnamed protein product [Ceutorhynchus assimilis]|uniref:U2 snRNP-associated SURP motif-containing protein n=1 Tax=Ceutorhynchus assimilis TaxID=467358 RepID=A0A9N9MUI0_9CUCU|nr:unnamed protein product [Ceutorhynchus assimilis]
MSKQKKQLKEQEEAAHVFVDFVNSFEKTAPTSKTFVKSGILYGDKTQLASTKVQLYAPKPIVKSASKNAAIDYAKLLNHVDDNLIIKKKKNKVKSNLELLKEEIQQRQSEKNERERLKQEISNAGPPLSPFDEKDLNSTNLFISNLNARITEAHLVQDFGKFGPLASVKIMWPRGESGDEKFRRLNTNCGFVAYMSRKDAERALNHMKHRTDMKVGWGKSVELPKHPVYIPQDLLRMFLPPPQSGLPFNAQTDGETAEAKNFEDVLIESVVKVTVPLCKKTRILVNRMAEYVIKDGHLFEAMIMNREINNPDYQFLFDNKSANHIYYRWKLFSILQGDSTKQWNMNPFRMFKSGSIWLPPIAPNYEAGMPEELINKDKYDRQLLSENQSEHLVELIQNLNLSSSSIADAMVFCLQHEIAINDSLEIIFQSLCRSSTKPPSKVARFYLLYDILYNCSNKNLQIKFETIFDEFSRCFKDMKNDVDKLMFSSKVIKVVRQLQLFGHLSAELTKKFEDCFNQKPLDIGDSSSDADEPLDGANLRKRSLGNNNEECVITSNIEATQIKPEYFVPSKWNSLDAEEIESQSMSSSKLYFLEMDKTAANDQKEELLPCKKATSKKYKHSREDSSKSPTRYSRSHKSKKRKC